MRQSNKLLLWHHCVYGLTLNLSQKKTLKVKIVGCSFPPPHPLIYMWKANNLTIRGKTGSHGCVGLAEDIQVPLTLCGCGVSAWRWRTGRGRRPICVETSVGRIWFAPLHFLLHVIWIHWQRGALWSCRGGGDRTGSMDFKYLHWDFWKQEKVFIIR